MGKTFLRSSIAILVLVAGVLLPAQWAQAQDVPTGNLYNLKTAAFPIIKFSVDAYDVSGNFITDLSMTDFTILEDGQKRTPSEMVVFDPGVEFVVAINPGRSFAILDNKAESRYVKIARALGKWAGTLPAVSGDAYSLVTVGGPSAFHTKDPQSWLTSLNAYLPDSKNLSPSFDLLTRAMDIASGPTLETGVRRAILFITPMVESADISNLQSLALRASQLDVHVFVWVVASGDSPVTLGFQALQDLATKTGGISLLYSGSETLPSPTEYLVPMHTSYQLTYASGLTTSGSHSLLVSITSPVGEINMIPLNFEMDIQPPNPILIIPPKEILRQPTDINHYDVNTLIPANQKLELIIEFPDGHPRALASTSLVVDGQTVAKNTSEPFNQFVWDLKGISVTGKHDLQVEVVDMLGLQKLSIPIPIKVTIAEAPSGWNVFLSRYGHLVAIGAASLASLLLVWLLIGISRKRRAARKARQTTTSHTSIMTEGNKQSILHRRVKKTPAFLEPIPENGLVSASGYLQLVSRDIRFGSDPAKVDCLLIDNSVEPLHAIIYRQENTFSISDQGTLAGTWLNYEMLPEGQHLLKHRDLLHFGSLAFRFILSDPPKQPEPLITLEKPGK